MPRPHNGEKTLFNKWWWQNWISTREKKKRKIDLYLTPYTKSESKWTKELDVRLAAIKLLGENVGEKLHEVRLATISWIRHQEHKPQKQKNRHIGPHQT